VVNSVILELVRESLIAVVNEMRANMIYASYSSVIFEGHDFSCALMTADGRQIAQGLADHPIHIFAVPSSTAEILNRFAGDIHAGDVFLHNDPYTGGTHLNDVLMLFPIFDEDALVLFAAVRAHWNDVGGMTPGSLSGRVTEILQEGIRIPPIKICSHGVMNDAALSLLFANMRVERERRGDFNCMLGTCRRAEEHVRRLCGRFGRDTLVASMAELIERAAARMKSRIAMLPEGTYWAEGFIETDGHSLEPLPIRTELTIAGDRLKVDFTGTAQQVAGPVNAGKAMAANSVFTIVKSFLDPHTAINHGSFEPIEVVVPMGTIANARLPAPCGGMAEIKFAIDSVVAAALAQAIPEMRFGDVKGTANHIHITCQASENSEPQILYEWPAAGTGATSTHDGNSVLRTFAEGDFNSIHSIEVIESRYPLRVIRSEIRAHSCGDGEYRGGFGLLREVEVRSPKAQLSVLSDRNLIPPYGVNGGTSGAPNRFSVLRDDEEIEPSSIPGKVSGFPLRRGDIVREQTSGGGGWGDPLKRDPALVAEDVRQGHLDRPEVEERYGVVLTDAGKVDAAQTEAKRSALRSARRQFLLQVADDDDAPKRRMAYTSPQSLTDLQLSDGDLIEIVRDDAPLIRAWIKSDTKMSANIIRVATDAARILRSQTGDPVRVRSVGRAPAAP
jgi:N-methylhydantoinase B